MTAGELADDHRWGIAHDRGNDGGKAAPIRELRIQQWIVFVEFLPESVRYYFKARAQARCIELDARVAAQNPVPPEPPSRVRVAPDFADAVVKQERLDGAE